MQNYQTGNAQSKRRDWNTPRMKIVTHLERELKLNSLEETDDIADSTMTTPKLTSRPKKDFSSLESTPAQFDVFAENQVT